METKYKYLLNFYSKEKLDNYLNKSNIDELYEQCLPQDIAIGKLKDYKGRLLVNSPDGYVPVKSLVRKKPEEILEVSFSNGKNIRTSPFHMFETVNGSFISTVNLKPGTKLIADNDEIVAVVSIIDTGKVEDIYDLSVDHKNHRYYTNGISSHNSGAGKSIFLQNLAINWVEQGLNVIYLSLELSEKLCAMRLDAMVADCATTDVLKNIEDVSMRVRSFHKRKKGNLCIKQLPNGCTANDVRAYIKEYEVQKGIKVDAVCLDYLDLCMPMSVKVSPSDMFVKDKYVSEELRNLAVDLDILFATASQLNRCLTLDTEIIVDGRGNIKIKDVKPGDRILSDNGYNEVKTVFPVTKQKVYQIKTKSGKTIKCSAEHVFPTTNGEKKIASGLSVGDILYTKSP